MQIKFTEQTSLFQGCHEPIRDREKGYIISVPAKDVSTFITE
jgi:hypothetical protein